MKLKVVGAGLPRTGTHSLQMALSHLLDGRCYPMREIPGHPFDLGEGWDQALAGDTTDLDRLLDGYAATVDWPASMFWHELSQANPDSLVLLSVRGTPETWWQSVDATILRSHVAPSGRAGRKAAASWISSSASRGQKNGITQGQ